MEKVSPEIDYTNNDDVESKTLFQKIFDIVRENWLAFLCALIITLITIIVIPIIYTLDKPNDNVNQTTLSWNISAVTIINKTNFINNANNNSIGIISSLSFDSSDNLYLLDKTYNRLLKYVSKTNALTLVFGHEGPSMQTDLLFFPNDFFINSNNIYIADSFNHRIVLFQIDTQQNSIIFGKIGTPGTGTDLTLLNQPMSLTMDDQSNLYIADYGNNRIILINVADTSSPLQGKIIIPNNPNSDRHTYLSTPISIKYDRASSPASLVIAQETGFNVIRWLLNDNTNAWTLIAGSASSELNGTSRTLFNKLCSVDIDTSSHIYVTDCNNQRIQYYKTDMEKGKTIAGVIQAEGNNTYTFKQPSNIALDSLANLYVADSLNYRIQRFAQLH